MSGDLFGSVEREGVEDSLGSVEDSPGSSGSFPYSFPYHPFPPVPFGYRRGPGRPRKDGNTAYQRQGGRGQVGRVRSKSQLFQQRFSQSSSPSTSSPDTPVPGDSPFLEASLASFNDGPKCSFCYLPESSLLGQGELLKHPKSPDFDLQTPIVRSPEAEAPGDHNQIRQPHLPQHPRTKEELGMLFQRGEIFSEIEIVGLPDDVSLQDLINQATEYKIWAHFCCGAWSDGVIQAEDYSLINVDKAVGAGLRQRCAGCGSFGATISCKHKACTAKFHYPCASGYGGFLDIKNLVFLCPQHVLKAPDVVKDSKDADCAKCKKSSGVEEQLFCTSCGQHFHGGCLDPPVEPCLQTRAGWLCNECKICQTCKNATDDDKMLVCELCDKGYHTYCMQPPLSSVPKQSWKCKFCRVCKDCGSRRPGSGTSSRWHLNFSICDSCYQQRNKGLICPVCNRAYRHQKQKSMIHCHSCQKYIHYDCDVEGVGEGAEELYVCPVCKKHPPMEVYGRASVSASPSISTVGEGEEEEEYLTNLIKTELGDSLSGADSPFGSEFGPGLGDVDFSALTGQEDSNLSGVQSGSESGFGRFPMGVGLGMSSVVGRSGAGKALSARKRQYRRSRSGGKGPEAYRGRLPPQPGRRRGRPSKFSMGVSSCGEESSGGMRRGGKDKDDEEYIHTVVVASSKDDFVMCQDMCVICGSFGKGEEGRLIACAQCGQCYHPYCANVKMSGVVMRRGWRCLDCTVCEGCGQGDDEPHLLLCDDCDVSFHTYCLDPPLEHIPQGPWRCHWCAKCQRCGNLLPAVSSLHSSFCVACESLVKCARCNQHYREGDHMILCQNCSRWCHGKCEALMSEELLETASERGFRCVYCRPMGTHCLQAGFHGHSEEDAMTVADGVVLTKSGVEAWNTRSSTAMVAVKRHLSDSRGRGGVLAGASSAIQDTIDEVTAAVAKTFTAQISEDCTGMDLDRAESMEDMRSYEVMSPMPGEMEGMRGRGRGDGRRGRRVPKLGVGGFIVRPTRQRTTTIDDGGAGDTPEGSVWMGEEGSQSVGGGENIGGMISPAMDSQGGEKIKRRKRRSRKGLIEETYPNVIQDSFFGGGCMLEPSPSLMRMSDMGGRASPGLEEQHQAFTFLHNNDSELSHLSADQLRKQTAQVEAGPPGAPVDGNQLSLDDLDDDLLRSINDDRLISADMLVDSESLFKMLDNIGGSGMQDSRGHSPIGNMDPNPLVTDLNEVDNFMNELNPTLGGEDHSQNSQQSSTEENMASTDYHASSMNQDGGNYSDVSNGTPRSSSIGLHTTMDPQMSQEESRGIHPVQQEGSLLPPGHIPSHPHHPLSHMEASQDQALPSSTPQPHHSMPVPPPPIHAAHVQHSQEQAPMQQHHYLSSLQQEVSPVPRQGAFPPLNQVAPSAPGGGAIPSVASGFFPPGQLGGAQSQGHPGILPPPGMRPLGPSFGVMGGGPRPLMSPTIQPPMGVMDHPGGLQTQVSTGSTGGSDLKSQLERWEQDEPLGDKATIASVLYANIHHGDFKTKYPTWSERVKHIQKQWRILSAEDRARWVQLARDNRAACRQKRKNSKVGTSTPPTPSASTTGPPSFIKQEHSELSRSPMDSNPSTPHTAGPHTPSTPIDNPVGGGGAYSPRGPRPSVFGESQQQQQVPGAPQPSHRMPFPQDQQMIPRFPAPIHRFPPPHHLAGAGEGANNPFKVPQRPMQDPLGPPQEGLSGPMRPGSLMIGTQSPGAQPQSMLDDLMDIERRERTDTQLSVSVGGHFPQHPQPPPHIPYPHQQGWGGRFPIGPSGGMMRPMMAPQPIFKDPQHETLVRKMEETSQQQRVAEEELGRLRKMKKNLAAKQRQLKKQELELPEEEKIHLESLTRDIQERQKRVEYAKKQVKQSTQQLQDYEVKNNLVPPVSSGGQPRLPLHHTTTAQYQPQQSPLMYHQSTAPQGSPILSPQPQFLMRGPQMMSARMRGPIPPGSFPPGGSPVPSAAPMTSPYKVTVGDTNPFSETFEERERIERQKQAMYGMRQPYGAGVGEGPPPRFPTPLGDNSCDSQGSGRQSSEGGGKKKVYKKRRKKSEIQGNSEFGPAADMLMNIPRPPLEDVEGGGGGRRVCGVTGWVRDVYETVQFLVDRVSFQVDGDDGERSGNALLKSLLETSSPSEREPPRPKPLGRPPSTGMKRGGGPGSELPVKVKRGKKGSKGRVGGVTAYDDYSVFVERVGIELRGLPRLSVQEPVPRADRFSCQLQGLTNLPERSDKPLVVSEDLGAVRLSFLPDFYREEFGKPPVEKVQPPLTVATGHPGATKTLERPHPETSHLLVPAERRHQPPPLPPAHYTGAPQKSVIQQLKSLEEKGLELIYERGKEVEEEEVSLSYPALKTAIPPEGRVSPNFRLMLAIPIVRPVPPDPPRSYFYQTPERRCEVKREVACSVTLSSEAAKNVSNVMQGLALLLNLSSPIEYHIETPPHTPEKDGWNREGQEGVSPQYCLQCRSMAHQESVKKRFAELGLTPKEDDKDFAVFCSSSCYSRFMSVYKSQPVEAPVLPSPIIREEEIKKELSHPAEPPMEDFSEVEIEKSGEGGRSGGGGVEDLKLDAIIESVVGGRQAYSGGTKEVSLHVRDLPQTRESVGEKAGTEEGARRELKRWKGHRWQTWNRSFLANLTRYQEQLNALMDELKSVFCPTLDMLPVDRRRCELCSGEGDGIVQGAGRLLNVDAARWVHVNCALWSSEVYETVGGALINVDAAVRRGQTVGCVECGRTGATVPCYKLRCDLQYHFPCALQAGCGFTPDKTVLCPEHKVEVKQLDGSKMGVLRRVYIERDEDHLIAKLFQQGDVAGLTLRVGSLIFHHIGQLLPHQLKAFHTKDFVYPVGYSVTRFYWSPAFPNRRVKYHCSVLDHGGSPEFVVRFSDNGCAELTCKAQVATEVWNKILDPLELLRHKKGPGEQLKLFPRYLTGELLFGLSEPSILKMIESLPGVDTLLSYTFKYGRNPLMDLPLAVNPSGCARTEPRFRTYLKRHHITHAPTNTGNSANSPTGGSLTWQELALMFGKLEKEAPGASSKWSLYKKMKAEWRNTVHLGRSKIQGLGLYAKRDIDMNSMIIEYLGDVIRNEVAERREKQYQEQNRGVYMFRLDAEKVVDATMSGGPARYINHSCDPNCATQLLTINGDLKIVVMACRPISKHEELTYDYQFDFEDESSKIPCLCGAPNCRKWMN